MAAVAGSKGRLEFQSEPTSSLQMSVVKKLLDRSCSSTDAATILIRAAALREVGIDTNMICNLKCQYCYLDDRPEAKGTARLDELKTRFEYLSHAGVKLFAFIGKEPLSDNRAIDLLLALNKVRSEGHKFRTGMVTNGTLVSRWLDQLVETELSYLDISVDGLTDNENRLRGGQVADRILAGVKAIVNSPLRDRFATATVLTKASVNSYPQFVEQMFQHGVRTCFASPVLRFAVSNDVVDYSVTLEETWRLAEYLAERHSSGTGEQIILDLPYRYTWTLLRSGRVPVSMVREDAFEALYWQFQGSNVYLKLNPFTFSYWRALRITHDGKAIINMDLAAHPQYGEAAAGFQTIDADIFQTLSLDGKVFLDEFISRHVLGEPSGQMFERDLDAQYMRHRQLHHSDAVA